MKSVRAGGGGEGGQKKGRDGVGTLHLSCVHTSSCHD